MSATSIRTAATGPLLARSPRMMPQQEQGFPTAMLTHLYLLKETSLTSGLKDEVTGASVTTRNGTLQAGGGIQFAEGAILGPPIDVRLPFTICAGLTLAPPPGSGLQARRALLSVGDYDQNGFLAWNNPPDGAPLGAGQPFGVSLRQTIDGAPAQVWPGIGWQDSTVLYGKPMVLMLSSEGLGSVLMQLWRKLPSGDGALLAQVATEWDLSRLAGSTNGLRSYTLSVRPGTINGIADYAPGTAIYDSFATYRGALNDREMLTYVQANAALAASRGRTA